jgi:transposase
MDTSSETILVRNLDHLGLIAGMIDKLGFVDEINRLIPNQRKVSYGIMIKALILNAMGFSQHALYITPQFFERCPVKHLLGDSYEASDFNDDSIGRLSPDAYTIKGHVPIQKNDLLRPMDGTMTVVFYLDRHKNIIPLTAYSENDEYDRR